jgi:hypothetical protein
MALLKQWPVKVVTLLNRQVVNANRAFGVPPC